VEPRRRHLAVARETALVLRPQPMHDEGVGPAAALLARLPAALLGFLAERWRPRQRQHIEIEFARLVALRALRRALLLLCGRGAERDGGQKDRNCSGAKDDTHGMPLHSTRTELGNFSLVVRTS